MLARPPESRRVPMKKSPSKSITLEGDTLDLVYYLLETAQGEPLKDAESVLEWEDDRVERTRKQVIALFGITKFSSLNE
jgi:hypothetical protein